MWGPEENLEEDIGEVQSSCSSRHQHFEDASPIGSSPEQQRQWSGAGLSTGHNLYGLQKSGSTDTGF